MKIIAIILMLTGAFSESYPDEERETLSPSEFEEVLEEGIDAFYRTDWSHAKDIFEKLKEKDPDDPRPYFFESMIPFWEYFFIRQENSLAREFLDQSEKAVNFGEKQLQRSPNDTTTVLLLSGLHGYRSLVAAGEKEYRVAMQSGITGFRYTRKLLSIDSERPDAQIGRGMFYYMVGSIPREMRWLSNAAGIRGDIETGFEQLKKAAASDNPVSNDAKMILMYLYDKEERYEDAYKYAEKLVNRFPENVIFHYRKGDLLQKLGKYERAEESFETVIALDNSSLPKLSKLSKERVEELKLLTLRID